MPDQWPHISVIIATRNRPRDAARAVSSVLCLDYPRFNLLVVDQSDTSETRNALQLHRNDARLTVIFSQAAGLAHARNLGCRSSESRYIAFTDDDCEVTSTWLHAIAAAFLRDPTVGVVYGNVQSGDYDRSAGFIPAYEVSALRIVSRVQRKTEVEGIGACMAVRRDVWTTIGGFDELLGTGAPFRSGEDVDLTVRTLNLGIDICEDPAVTVRHHGFRSWDAAPKVIAGYMYGIGAVYAKMLRIAGVRAIPPTLALGWRWLAKRPVVDLNHTPDRGMRLISFFEGYRAGLNLGLDEHGRFIPTCPGVGAVTSTTAR